MTSAIEVSRLYGITCSGGLVTVSTTEQILNNKKHQERLKLFHDQDLARMWFATAFVTDFVFSSSPGVVQPSEAKIVRHCVMNGGSTWNQHGRRK